MLPGIDWLQMQLGMTRYIERDEGHHYTQKEDVRRLRGKPVKERSYLYNHHPAIQTIFWDPGLAVGLYLG